MPKHTKGRMPIQFAFALLTLAAPATLAQNIAGSWQGTFQVGGDSRANLS